MGQMQQKSVINFQCIIYNLTDFQIIYAIRYFNRLPNARLELIISTQQSHSTDYTNIRTTSAKSRGGCLR